MRPEPVARVALVVEDEWIVRDHIVRELKAHGWTVIEATTGEDALALLDVCEVNVLLTDIQLASAMNGWEVAHAVRAAIPQLPVICASGNTPDASQRVDGSLFFHKPYDPADIVAAFHDFIAAK